MWESYSAPDTAMGSHASGPEHALTAEAITVHAQVRLLNGCALCNMRMGNWEEAEQQLLEAFEKDAKNADTLANLVTACLHLGKATSRYSK